MSAEKRPVSPSGGPSIRRRLGLASANELALDDRLEKLEAEVQNIATGVRHLTQTLKQVDLNVQGVFRQLCLDDEELPFPQRLTSRRFRFLSQNGEDGLTLALFKAIGTTDRRFVEIGSGTNGGNCGFLAQECGWRGLMVDASEARIVHVKARFGPAVDSVAALVARDNLNQLLADHGLSGDVDLVSIDVEGNDYWLWECLSVCSPRVVIMEYNASFGPSRSVTVPYDPTFDRRVVDPARIGYYGASLTALTRLGARKGYRLVAVEPRGVNAYFLRHDIEPEIPAQKPEDLFREPKLAKAGETVFAAAERLGLSLVEIE